MSIEGTGPTSPRRSVREANEAASKDIAAYEWARAEQGYAGKYADWIAMSAKERAEYELGAQGIPTG